MPNLFASSIVACDPEYNEWGVALQSPLLSGGSRIPFVQEGIGALAVETTDNTELGYRGLKYLSQGHSPQKTIQYLLQDEEQYHHCQLALVDRHGIAAAYSGDACSPWAGHVSGPYYACLGRGLHHEEVLHNMAFAFNHTQGDLADRLVKALAVGQNTGENQSEPRSAALLIKGSKFSNQLQWPLLIDLRVDDHPSPVQELKRLLALHRLTFLHHYTHRHYAFEPSLQKELLIRLQQLYPLYREKNSLSQKNIQELCAKENLPHPPFQGNLINGQVIYHLLQRP